MGTKWVQSSRQFWQQQGARPAEIALGSVLRHRFLDGRLSLPAVQHDVVTDPPRNQSASLLRRLRRLPSSDKRETVAEDNLPLRPILPAVSHQRRETDNGALQATSAR
jgi:hypothetical protein